MASIRSLKKKIHQQSFVVLLTALIRVDNNMKDVEKIQKLSDELNDFTKKSIQRINQSRGWKKEERRAELKSVNEQLDDKFATLLKMV